MSEPGNTIKFELKSDQNGIERFFFLPAIFPLLLRRLKSDQNGIESKSSLKCSNPSKKLKSDQNGIERNLMQSINDVNILG